MALAHDTAMALLALKIPKLPSQMQLFLDSWGTYAGNNNNSNNTTTCNNNNIGLAQLLS